MGRERQQLDDFGKHVEEEQAGQKGAEEGEGGKTKPLIKFGSRLTPSKCAVALLSTREECNVTRLIRQETTNQKRSEIYWPPVLEPNLCGESGSGTTS